MKKNKKIIIVICIVFFIGFCCLIGGNNTNGNVNQESNTQLEVRNQESKQYEEIYKDDEVSSATFSDEYILLSVKSDYMTVSEFAKLYNVTDITVRQWIRRGKIRSAKKQGRDWIIPDIADKPKRGFQDVTYMWKELTSEIEDKYPFLKEYNNMFIFQNKEDKGLYDVILSNYKTRIREKIQISNIKREQLELELISSGLVEIDEPKIFHM